MSKISSKRNIVVPSDTENAEILAGALSDPDAQPLTDEQLLSMRPIKSVMGRPRMENKKLLVSIRYSPEVIEYFRATGEGWQAKMDSVLKEYVSNHPR